MKRVLIKLLIPWSINVFNKVKCKVVLFQANDHPWVAPFVAKNRNFRIEPYTFELRTRRGTELHSGQRVVERVPPTGM